jgi:hypothetical protein
LGNDTLLHYLTTTGNLSNQEFGEAYQTLHDARRRLTDEHTEYPVFVTADRRASMRLYGQLGFGDYDAMKGQLRVQSPTMLLLPVPPSSGRRVLLTGGRTRELLASVRQAAVQHNVKVSVSSQHESNGHLLLPDRIELTAVGPPNEGFGLTKLKALAEQCEINICTDLLQAELLAFSVKLEDYRASLQPYEEELPDDWKQLWFDPQVLRWLPGPGNKAFSLVEFEFTVYRKECYLWQDGKPYAVDKSWGRYLTLAHVGKQVLLHSQKQQLLAVPASAPLPELLARSAALLSGYAPEQRPLLHEGQFRRYNIYQTPGAYTMLYNKLPVLLGQKIIEIPVL